MKRTSPLWSIIMSLGVVLTCASAQAEKPVFTLVETVSAADLDRMLDVERGEFIASAKLGEGYQLPPVSTAANAVEIYTVRYESHIPELGNRKIMATGLVALPVLADRKKLPLISYQHGTVFGKLEVPSHAFEKADADGGRNYSGSYETRYMVGLYAGNGYALMAADYFGMGGGAKLPEAYFVKAATQQGNYDLYLAVQSFLKSKDIAQSQLFLGGWSLGGLNTTGFLERLEDEGVKVTAAFTASSPSDPYAAINGLLYYPRPGIDAPWLNTIVALTIFSYQNYYGPKDFAKSVINPQYYAAMKSLYDRSYKDPEALSIALSKLATVPLVAYLKPEYADPTRFAASAYGKYLSRSETYRQSFKAPLRTYFGTLDEVVKPMIGQLPALYQATLIGDADAAAKSTTQPQKVEGANHRLTFITAAPSAKAWIDTLMEQAN